MTEVDAGNLQEPIRIKVERLDRIYGIDRPYTVVNNTGVRELLIKKLEAGTQHVSVLDVCAGLGNGTHPIVEYANKLNIGVNLGLVDVSEDLLKDAKVRFDVRGGLLNPDLNNVGLNQVDLKVSGLPFEDGTQDIVVFYRALHEFRVERQIFLLREANRVLNKEGQVVILCNLIPGADINGVIPSLEPPRDFNQFFNNLVRFKDYLANVTSRDDARFPSREQMVSLGMKAGFIEIRLTHSWNRKWNTLHRFPELGFDRDKLRSLNDFVTYAFHDFGASWGLDYEETSINSMDDVHRIFGDDVPEGDLEKYQNLVGYSFDVPTGFVVLKK